MQNTHRLNKACLTGLITAFWLLSLSPAQAKQAEQNTVVIGALASGQVTQVYVKQGQAIKKGDKLLTLDASRYQAKKQVLQAQLKVSKLELDDAKIELNQALDLFDRTVTSKRTLDASQLRFDKAQAAYDKANAELQLHRAWSKYVYIKAPISGTVKKLFTPLGATVYKENTPMLEITP